MVCKIIFFIEPLLSLWWRGGSSALRVSI